AYNLVTGIHQGRPDGIQLLGVGTTDFVANPRISDPDQAGTPWIALRVPNRSGDPAVGGRIMVLPFNLDPSGWRTIAGPENGFTEVGPNPSVSDDGSLIVFSATHSKWGRGIYVADPRTGQWTKIVGESGDGVLDPGEHHIDSNGDGVVES